MIHQWVYILPGSLIFTLSAMFFASRLVKDTNRQETGAQPGTISAFDLFFMLTSLLILLVLWVEPLRRYFLGLVGLCAVLIWLGWKSLKAHN